MNEDFLKYLHKTEDGEMNNERKAYRPNKNRIRETLETDETDDLNDKVEFLKERLYKKIDACFIQFGLRGLTKIDESIADGLTEFIHSEREPNRVNRVIRPKQTKRPIDIEEEDDTEDNTEVNFYDADSIIGMASQIDIGDAQDYADTSVKKVKRIADVTPVTKKKKPVDIKKESSVVPDDFGGMDLDSIGDAIEE